jgi:hypothetical protein
MKRAILIYGAIAVALIMVGFLIWAFVSPSGQPKNSPSVSNVPDYYLAPEEEAHLQSFVKTFVELYNTYSTGDYSNLYALGDYQTTALQSRTKALIEELDRQTPENFDIVSQEDENSFKYSFRTGTILEVSVLLNVTETQPGKNAVYQNVAALTVIKDGPRYFVDKISYTKK